jgi:hypothetical protein
VIDSFIALLLLLFFHILRDLFIFYLFTHHLNYLPLAPTFIHFHLSPCFFFSILIVYLFFHAILTTLTYSLYFPSFRSSLSLIWSSLIFDPPLFFLFSLLFFLHFSFLFPFLFYLLISYFFTLFSSLFCFLLSFSLFYYTGCTGAECVSGRVNGSGKHRSHTRTGGTVLCSVV